MAELSEFRQKVIKNILDKIAECEGGSVEVLRTENNDIVMALKPDIPISLWCMNCKRRIVCKMKLMARWTSNRRLKTNGYIQSEK